MKIPTCKCLEKEYHGYPTISIADGQSVEIEFYSDDNGDEFYSVAYITPHFCAICGAPYEEVKNG